MILLTSRSGTSLKLYGSLPLLGKIVAADVPSASEADAAPAVYAHFMVSFECSEC